MTDATVDQGASVDKSTVAATSQPEAASEPTKAPTTTTEPKSEGGEDTEPGPAGSEADRPDVPSTDAQPAPTDMETTTDKEEADAPPTAAAAAEEEAPQSVANGTPASTKKNQKRKSFSGVPEHKTKKLNKKKSVKDLQLHLDVKPGEYYFARMRGYPAWPSIICDEKMLPEILLRTRPVSAMRMNGTYREDFEKGGKNVADRTYPIMFLATNEFAWHVNTALEPLDVEKIKNATPEKKSKQLAEAYEIAAQGHDLQYFQDMLEDHKKALNAELEDEVDEDEVKKPAKEKGKRKSKAEVDEDGDVVMQDDGDANEDGDKKSKPSKKRKKDVDSEGEALKPAKTPKTKLKVNGPKTPNEDSASKPKAKAAKAKKSESKVKVDADDEEKAPDGKAEEKPLTETEKKERRQKGVLFLRHKLQRGFLMRDQAPKEEEMTAMSDIFDRLEQYADLEPAIIRATKINKVLKGIIKLNSIPKDEEHKFKKRSADLLSAWNKALASDPEPPAEGEAAETKVNGVSHAEDEDKSKDANADSTADAVKKSSGDADGDATVDDAQPQEASTEAPTVMDTKAEEAEATKA